MSEKSLIEDYELRKILKDYIYSSSWGGANNWNKGDAHTRLAYHLESYLSIPKYHGYEIIRQYTRKHLTDNLAEKIGMPLYRNIKVSEYKELIDKFCIELEKLCPKMKKIYERTIREDAARRK